MVPVGTAMGLIHADNAAAYLKWTRGGRAEHNVRGQQQPGEGAVGEEYPLPPLPPLPPTPFGGVWSPLVAHGEATRNA